MFRLGLDVGGTKIEIVALNANGQVCWRERSPTPQGDYIATVDLICSLVFRAESALGRKASVGIGIPGSESPSDGRIRNANSTCLNGQALRVDLENRLQRAVRIANDANCFALSEAVDGAGANAHVVFGVILGTGVGGGIVVDRQVLRGANAIAGEWGHNPLPGRLTDNHLPLACYCGRAGCIETYLSGPAMTAWHQQRTGATVSAVDIASQAETGNPDCLATLIQWEEHAGRALASIVNILDPDVIVLGGGLSNVDRFYRTLPDACRPHGFSDVFCTPILPPKHGDASGVRGAAWLWPDAA